MGSRFKQSVEARIAKTGQKWAGAVRKVRATRKPNGSGPPEPPARRRRTKVEAIALAKGPLGGEVYKLSASYIEPISG